MQPKIIENFISKDTSNYINDYFVKNIHLDDQGQSTIYVKNTLPFYHNNNLFETLKNKNLDEALFHDTLKLLLNSIKIQFGFKADEIDVGFFNYRNFGPEGQVKDYHVDVYTQEPGEIFTALVYLTDDYKGGEIIFYDGEYPEAIGPVTYSPKIGSLFLFRGLDGHKINPVISGRRALLQVNLRNIKL